jgi:methylase of polypeptide subunit release factors
MLPQLTKDFIKDIEDKAKKGSYTCDVGDIKIKVSPYVFPPASPFSESSHTVYDEFGNLDGKDVLEIGVGTGIQSIKAAKAGAKKVDAVDIYLPAVECARENVEANGLTNKINVWQSDLFSEVKVKYDLIIANLPIVDASEDDVRFYSLIDPDFNLHKRLFQEAKDYLLPKGRIVLCDADLQEGSFERLESLANENNFKFKIRQEVESLGYTWRNYEFQLEGSE